MFVNSGPTWVPIGTTVRNAIERLGHFAFPTAIAIFNEFSLARQYYQMSNYAPAPQTNYLNMIFSPVADAINYLGPDVYELPIIAGDSIKITVSTM